MVFMGRGTAGALPVLRFCTFAAGQTLLGELKWSDFQDEKRMLNVHHLQEKVCGRKGADSQITI